MLYRKERSYALLRSHQQYLSITETVTCGTLGPISNSNIPALKKFRAAVTVRLTMFFSVQHLIGQDAKFSLVWRAATSGTAKKLPRRAVLNLSVSNMCKEILKFAPTGKYTEAELNSKFSLYLLGQLLYGTVLIYDRQVTLFKIDVQATYEKCRRLPMEELLNARDLFPEKKRHRRSKMIELNAGDIDIDEQPESRFVGLARRCEITMLELEAEPLIWRRQDLFSDEEIQAPVVFSKDGFIDWDDQRSSQSSKESIKTISERRKEFSYLSYAIDFLEYLPPLPQAEVFQNMDRKSSMEETQMVDGAGDVGQQSVVQPEPLSENGPATKKPRMHEESHQEKREQAGDAVTISLELSPLHDETKEGVNLVKRRKAPHLLDVEGLCISYESMKKMHSDYSSLLRTKEELRAGMAQDKYPTLHELLLPYPAYARNRFPKECIELYRSRFSDTLTYEQALCENLFDPINRGPPSQLWRYPGSDQSSKDDSEYDLLPGIAFLRETPDRIRAAASGGTSRDGDERSKRAKEADSALLTPGKATIMETPNREKETSTVEGGQGDAHRRNYHSMPPGFPAATVAADTSLPLGADISLPERERFRESRSSFFEQARRITRGTDDMEGRPSSVQLQDPALLGDISQASMFSASGRVLSLSSSLREKITSEEGRLITDATREANRPIPFSSLIPPAVTSKKRAARVFSTLLDLAGKTVVEAKQIEPYGEIWVRACSATTSSDHDIEGMTSGGSFVPAFDANINHLLGIVIS
ncbi:hypothetical protein RB195_004325 [Necator americanus]|uniref:Rad21/Rec8-like protein N-terminal domain-containing protein n=1 Tax=Necator americanus TaxID=51031 RepID=A0ABR1BLY3_NECAM